jgi:hypothetical protein
MDYIERLQKAIRDLHGCESMHVGTTPVKEVFQNKTIWEGSVETFLLIDHPTAQRCYAWSHAAGKNDKGTRYVAVLGIAPINSPVDAVKASIVAEARNKT